MVTKRTGIGARRAKGNPSISICCIHKNKASSDAATTSDTIGSASRTPAAAIERAAEYDQRGAKSSGRLTSRVCDVANVLLDIRRRVACAL